MPKGESKIVYRYITFFGLGEIRNIGRPATALIAASIYYLLSTQAFFEAFGVIYSFRYIQLAVIIVILSSFFLLLAFKKLPEYRGDAAVGDFLSILALLYSPNNIYSPAWIFFALCLYFGFDGTRYVKKIKKKLRNEEKFLFFSYFINNIISVIAAIVLHIIYGGYRALPLIGIFFGK